MDIISKKWALLVINTIGNSQTIRYSEIRDVLGEINSQVLSDRLKELEEAGLIKREAFAEIPPRVEYSLTKDGKALSVVSTNMLPGFSDNFCIKTGLVEMSAA